MLSNIYNWKHNLMQERREKRTEIVMDCHPGRKFIFWVKIYDLVLVV